MGRGEAHCHGMGVHFNEEVLLEEVSEHGHSEGWVDGQDTEATDADRDLEKIILGRGLEASIGTIEANPELR